MALNPGFNDDYDDKIDPTGEINNINETHQTKAMTEEVYADHVQVSDDKESNKVRGCWSSIVKFIRSFWATRWTIDKNEKDTLVKTTIRELVIYLIFLLVLCLISFNMTSTMYYYYTTVMQNLFLGTKAPDGNTFETINSIDHWWSFVEQDGPLLQGLYWDKWYNNDQVKAGEENFIFYENKLLGVPRMRQLRIKADSCQVHQDFQNEIDHCYAEYSTENQDTMSFGDKSNDAFIFKSEEELNGSGFTSPILKTSYDGAGYIQDLAADLNATVTRISDLKNSRWVDRQTRIIFIDFAVYNANINLFCVVRLVSEFPASGGVIPSSEFRTVKMTNLGDFWGVFEQVLEYIYLAFIVYYIIEEIIEIRIHRLKYFKNFWNILDIVIIILSIICVAFRIYRSNRVNALLGDLQKKTTEYPDFELISYLQMRYVYMTATLTFFAWIKLFKYISFNTTMTQLQLTLSRCAADIAGFSVMFMIIFIAYAQFGYLVFGQTVYNFSAFPESLFTLFRIILGDFDFHELEQANYILGPIFFITYVFLVFFVLLNMFLAIINDTYSVVKEELSMKESEFQLSDYIKKGYNKVLKKLHLKREHIKNIQDALNTADVNADKVLDWDEWRNDLRMRGIPDNEIEAVFAKYDTDGDMVLNEAEQKQLQEDLLKSQREVEGKMGQIENNANNAAAAAQMNEQSSDVFGTVNVPTINTGGNLNPDQIDGVVDTLGSHFVGHDEFHLVSRRIDKLERSVGAVVGKIDAVIRKLESLDRIKNKRGDGKMPRSKSGSSNRSQPNLIDIEGLSLDGSEIERRDKMQASLSGSGNLANIPLGMPQSNIENEVRARSRASSRASSSSRRK